MRIEHVVVDASPLICLAKSDLLELLPRAFPDIVIPEQVYKELLGKGGKDPLGDALKAKKLVHIEIPDIITSWDIGIGESSVLAFAVKNPDFWAIIDDREARRCAESLGCKYIGTVGVILLAKKRGIIPSVSDCLHKLQNAGLWMSKAFIEQIVTKFGDGES